MRKPIRYAAMLSLSLVMIMGSTCLTLPGGSGGPSNTAWTSRTVNSGQNVRPSFTAIQDIDKDGKNDVIVAYEGQSQIIPAVVIFFQSAIDSFTAVEIATGTNLTGPAALAIADLNGDTLFDIVVACNGRIVFLNSPANPRSTGWTQNIISQSDDAGTGQWSDVAIGDIDGANGPDIVACDSGVGRVNWFRSPAANITTGTGWTRIDVAVSGRVGAASVALTDFSGDSRLDVVSTAPGESDQRIAWYRNPTNPVTDAWDKFAVGNLTGATRLTLGDLNADGRSDVVATNPAGKQVGWYRRPTDATAAWNGFLLTAFTTATPVDVKVADINGNGQPDVIVGTQAPGLFRWFNPGSDQTAQWTENNLQDITDRDAIRFTTGDIDADGRPDVASGLRGGTASTDTISWYENPF